MRRIIVVVLSVLLALTLAAPVASGKAGQGAKAYGKGVAASGADWWTWVLSKPAAQSPLIGSYSDEERCDGRPVTSTRGDLWFLSGSPGGDTVVRTCDVPAGKTLYFPAANFVFVMTEPGETQKEARQAVNEFMDSVVDDPGLSVVVTVDGTALPSNRIVRADTPLFTIPLPEDNLFGLDAGNYRAVADGLWVTLPPLSKGEHTIRIQVRAPNVDVDPSTPGVQAFSQNVTYRLTVQ